MLFWHHYVRSDFILNSLYLRYYISYFAKGPSDLKATKSETTEITLEWKEPQLAVEENVNYIVSFIGLFCF